MLQLTNTTNEFALDNEGFFQSVVRVLQNLKNVDDAVLSKNIAWNGRTISLVIPRPLKASHSRLKEVSFVEFFQLLRKAAEETQTKLMGQLEPFLTKLRKGNSLQAKKILKVAETQKKVLVEGRIERQERPCEPNPACKDPQFFVSAVEFLASKEVVFVDHAKYMCWNGVRPFFVSHHEKSKGNYQFSLSLLEFFDPKNILPYKALLDKTAQKKLEEQLKQISKKLSVIDCQRVKNLKRNIKTCIKPTRQQILQSFYNNRNYSNFELVLQGETIYTRESIVKKMGDFFDACLKNEMKEAQSKKITLQLLDEDNCDTFKRLLKKWHGFDEQFSLEDVNTLFMVADMYMIPAAQEEATKVLEAHMSKKRWFYDDEEFKEIAAIIELVNLWLAESKLKTNISELISGYLNGFLIYRFLENKRQKQNESCILPPEFKDLAKSFLTTLDLRDLEGYLNCQGFYFGAYGWHTIDSNDICSHIKFGKNSVIDELFAFMEDWRFNSVKKIILSDYHVSAKMVKEVLTRLPLEALELVRCSLGKGAETALGLLRLKTLTLVHPRDGGLVTVPPHIENLSLIELGSMPHSPKLRLAHTEKLTTLRVSKRIDKSDLLLISNLQELDLDNAERDMNDQDVFLLCRLKNLKTLKIKGDGLTDAGLKSLAQLPIESLSIKKAEKISCDSLTCFPGLKHLFLQGYNDSFDLKRLGALKHLSSLHLFPKSGQFSQDDLHAISQAPLKELTIGGRLSKESDLRPLARLENLEKLGMYATGLSEEQCKELGKLKNLKVVDIREMAKEAFLKLLKGWTEVEDIYVEHSVPFNDILRLKNLKKLKINLPPIIEVSARDRLKFEEWCQSLDIVVAYTSFAGNLKRIERYGAFKWIGPYRFVQTRPADNVGGHFDHFGKFSNLKMIDKGSPWWAYCLYGLQGELRVLDGESGIAFPVVCRPHHFPLVCYNNDHCPIIRTDELNFPVFKKERLLLKCE